MPSNFDLVHLSARPDIRADCVLLVLLQNIRTQWFYFSGLAVFGFQTQNHTRDQPNELPMSEIVPPKVLDDAGRCCGRTPETRYRRWGGLPRPFLFCPKCDRAFTVDGVQIKNWAWAWAWGGGGFVATAWKEPRGRRKGARQ